MASISKSKEKNSSRKSTFKVFGNFFALHMVKRLMKRKKATPDEEDDRDALEAGFRISASKENGHSVDGNLTNAVRSRQSTSTNNTNKNGNGVFASAARLDLSGLSAMPGVFGLNNHGNTCFMNSVIQCLCNTDLFAEYFVMGQYKVDMKNCRKDRSKKYGTKGEVTEQLAIIIKSLWTGTYTPDMTKTLKEVMSKYGSQYKGSVQHDSQEFLLWLFDKMHEDVNIQPVKKQSFIRRQSFRKSKRSRKSTPADEGSSSKTIENSMSPTSFIQKFCQGYYRSSLTCPNCKKVSETTDPFLSISLPLKQRSTRPIYLNVAYLPNKRRSSSSSRRQMAGKTIAIGVEAPSEGKIYDLRQIVAGECGVHSRLLAFVDLKSDGAFVSYGDDNPISKIPSQNVPTSVSASSLYAFEMPNIGAKITSGTLPRNFASRHKKRNSLGDKFGKDGLDSTASAASMAETIIVILVNKQGIREQGKLFGRPIVFRTSRDISPSDLQSNILSHMTEYIKNGVKYEKMGSLFKLLVVDGLPNKSYLSQQAQFPLRSPTVNEALEKCPSGGPFHIKLIAEWDFDTKSAIIEKNPDAKPELQDSVRLTKVLHQQPVTCTLEECFDLHTKEEELGAEDAWLCPHCHKRQQGTLKKLNFFNLPDVLVLHLKRFHITNGRRTKLCTRVEFPVNGLDMSKHIEKPKSNGHIANNYTDWDHALRRRTISSNSHHHHQEEYLYDLYAICNHYGNLNSGHYTAACNNPLDGKWYLFDDSKTENIDESALSPQSAYILFYQRRTPSTAPSCGGASINTALSDAHWAFTLPQLKQKVQFNSQTHLHVNSVNRAKSFNNSHPIKSNTIGGLPRGSNRGDVSQQQLKENVNNNSNKIAAAVNRNQNNNNSKMTTANGSKDKKRKERQNDSDDDDAGGFDAPNRPFVRGLSRKASTATTVVSRPQRVTAQRDTRQYRSYRHSRNRRQQTSHV